MDSKDSQARGVSQPIVIFLVVLAALIIGIPVGLFLTGMIGGVMAQQGGRDVDKGKYGLGKMQVQALAGKVEAYALDNGPPPARLDDLISKPGNAPNWRGPYAKVSDLKDPFGHPFVYKAPGEHGDFDIIFLGKDGQAGGDGVNADYGNWQ